MKNVVLACAGLVLLPMVAISQERAASGNLQTEASWTALKNLVNAADGKASVAQITANDAQTKANNAQTTADTALTVAQKIESCGKKGMLYAPGMSGADAKTGCKVISVIGNACGNFKKVTGCTDATCKIRYLDRKTGNVIYTTIPEKWQDGDVYVWKNNSDNFVGAQCRNGSFVRFGTGL